MQSEPNLSVSNLNLTRGGKELYRDFSLEFAAGNITAILAPSGAGKTTLLNVLLGLLKTDAQICRPAERMACLFQEPRLLPARTVLRNVVLPLENLMDKAAAQKRAMFFLNQVALAQKANAYPETLSGGEKQRVAMARAFAFPSPVLLMDEPFQSQDLSLALSLMQSLEALLANEPRTGVLVTHSVQEALCLADRIVLLKGAPLNVIYDKPNPVRRSVSVKARWIAPTAEEQVRLAELLALLV